MKLLIVDDEELTRQGLLSSMDWNSLGIDEVLEANDGLNGYKAAQTHKPDIILSDVRMPRLDGITMLKKIAAQMPDTIFIFMSGYSDKEYLKAAIKLRAVSYVEKPLDVEELSDAIRSAVERHTSLLEREDAKALQNTVSASQLAFWLTLPYASSKDAIDSLSKRYSKRYPSPNPFQYAVTIIVYKEATVEVRPDFLESIETQFHDLIRPLHFHVLCTERNMHHYVFHLFRRSSFGESTLRLALEYLQRLFAPFGRYCIAKGPIISGISHIYESYTSAVIALQYGYFYDSGSILDAELFSGTYSHPDRFEDFIHSFRQSMEQSDEAGVHTICNQLYIACYKNKELLIKQVQSLYFRLFSILLDCRKSNRMEDSATYMKPDNLLDSIDRCFNYEELHQYLLAEIKRFFQDKEATASTTSAVYLIKNFISNNYSNADLSIKDISDYVCLSVSYMCTMFKSETGQTLNQYLTEYRMTQAKRLLEDPRNTISNISSKIGYNDGNYFGKTFKKYTGVSPSEYREGRGIL